MSEKQIALHTFVFICIILSLRLTRWNLFWIVIGTLLASFMMAHFLFPDQYQDAMWAIGAFLALVIDIILIMVAILVHRFLLKGRRPAVLKTPA